MSCLVGFTLTGFGPELAAIITLESGLCFLRDATLHLLKHCGFCWHRWLLKAFDRSEEGPKFEMYALFTESVDRKTVATTIILACQIVDRLINLHTRKDEMKLTR